MKSISNLCQETSPWFAAAIGLGVALGVALDQLAIGIALGVVAGLALARRSGRDRSV